MDYLHVKSSPLGVCVKKSDSTLGTHFLIFYFFHNFSEISISRCNWFPEFVRLDMTVDYNSKTVSTQDFGNIYSRQTTNNWNSPWTGWLFLHMAGKKEIDQNENCVGFTSNTHYSLPIPHTWQNIHGEC